MRRSTRLTAVPLCAAIMLATAGSALAIPNRDPGDPGGPPIVNQAPTAALSVSPNPALVSSLLVNAPITSAQAARVPGIDSVLGRNAVTFDASRSTDPDGSIVRYDWDLDGNGVYEKTTTTPTISRSYTAPGAFAVQVRVIDNEGATGVATQLLRVHRAPRAAIAAAPADITVGQRTTLSAAGSSDDDGIARYEWDLDGNGSYETNTGTSPTVQAAFSSVATKTVRVRVTDIYDASSSAEATVRVHAAPAAAFTDAPSPAVVGEQVVFDGTPSIADEPVVRFEWDLDGDGTFETDTGPRPSVTHTYPAPGSVPVRLRITDRQGSQAVQTRTLTVLSQPPVDRTAPVVRIGTRSARMSTTGRVTLTVACPASERLCAGRLVLGTRSGGTSVGSHAFRLGGGQRTTLHVRLSRSAQRTVKRHRRLPVRITATARDAAGNRGTARRTLTVRR
jgi:PKD repeat protein